MRKETKSELESARRQGEFEGQVMAKLGEIANSLQTIRSDYGAMDLRVRTVENAIQKVADALQAALDLGKSQIQDSHNTHLELQDNIDKVDDKIEHPITGLRKSLRELQDWRIWLMAKVTAIGASAGIGVELAGRLFDKLNN